MFPRVTIGVCVRNSEKFIGDAIGSITTQDFPLDRIKLVFVDDGSEDRTLSVIKDYVEKMDLAVEVIHTPWKGLGNARNLVIANSVGEYILWVDGDMVLSPDFLSKLVRFMEENPKASVAKGRQSLVPASNLLGTIEAYSRASGRMVDYQSKKGEFKAVGTGGALYRIRAVRQVGGFDDKLRGYNEDWDVEVRMRKAGWTFHTVNASFCDYERYGLTWRLLWQRYWLRGYQTRYFLQKNRGMIKHYRNIPPAAFLSGLLSSFSLFKITKERTVFLIPFLSMLKMIAWYVGFIRS